MMNHVIITTNPFSALATRSFEKNPYHGKDSRRTLSATGARRVWKKDSNIFAPLKFPQTNIGNIGKVWGESNCHINTSKFRSKSSTAICAAASAPNVHGSAEDELFHKLAEYCGMQVDVEVATSSFGGNGVFSKKQYSKGEVLMSIPTAACIVIKRDPEGLFTNSWSAPTDGSWKVTDEMLTAYNETGLAWDLVCALALLDAAKGNAGEFYSEYLKLLPKVFQLHIPFCQPDSILKEYQSTTILEGARAQKERMRTLFPFLMPSEEKEESDGPGLLQWAYACVRSRTFQLGDHTFAYIPFIDMLNHSDTTPSVYHRLSDSGDEVEVVVMKESGIQVGEELFLSYTGPKGESSQRLLQQYGFTLTQGNLADRLSFGYSEEQGTLSLAKIQDIIGDASWMQMMTGKDHRLYAAIKSLPLADDEEDESSTDANVELAQALLDQCKAQIDALPTSLEEDLKLLQESTSSALVNAIQYRVQEKMLLVKSSTLLRKYIGAS